MALVDVSHSGGPTSSAVVTSVSGILLPANRLRRYVLIRSLRTNTAIMFLHLSPEGPAVDGTGIPLYPGDAYEIDDLNLYIDNIFAITESGGSVTVSIQEGA